MLGIETLVKNYLLIAHLNGYTNITIFYFRFFVSKKKDENDILECAQEIEKLLESEKI